jgi:hypothetical protein
MRGVGLPLPPLRAPLEQHVERGQKQQHPPAMRNAGMEMPRKFSTASPATPNSVRIPTATRQARIATLRRSDRHALGQRHEQRREAHGSMITKSVTKAGM